MLVLRRSCWVWPVCTRITRALPSGSCRHKTAGPQFWSSWRSSRWTLVFRCWRDAGGCEASDPPFYWMCWGDLLIGRWMTSSLFPHAKKTKKKTDCGFVPRLSPQTPAVTWNTVDSIKHCFYRSLCLWSLMLPLVLPAAGGACDVHLQALQALSRQPIRALAAKQQPGSVLCQLRPQSI